MNILPGANFNLQSFKNPPTEYAVTYTWVWNAPITKSGIDKQLEDFSRIGVRSLYILPIPISFRPESNRTYLDPEYLTDEFFDLVKYAMDGCIERGMMPWIYDEGGWPSGGACYNTVRQNPNAKLKSLRKEIVTLEADKRFYPSGDDFIALFHGKRRLPDDYIASRTVELCAYYIKETANGSRIDYTSESATNTFISNTYEAYKRCLENRLGANIPVFFTDEPGLLQDSIAEGELKLFEEKYGYDLRDYLYVVESNGTNAVTEREKRARIDHLMLVGELSRQNYFEKLRLWCEENGVFFSGHLDIDNRPYGGTTKGYFSLMKCLRSFHIPGIDAIWEQIRYPYDGRLPVNDETRGMGFFPRLASSAARQEGRNVAVTETFSINGDSITPDEMRYIANYQAIRGINAFNFMTAPYGRGRLGAISGRPAFCPEKPGFSALKHVNEYYARLCYLTRLGHAEGDTALYLPASDFAASPDDLDRASEAFKAMGTHMENECIPFDIIDDDGIRDATDTADGLKIGDAIYRHIVVPADKYMSDDVRKKIERYLSYGEKAYGFTNKYLRVMTRKLDTGRLWFIFNEGHERVKETLDVKGCGRLYRLDARDGKVYSEDICEVDLVCGDMAVFMISDADIEAENSEVIYSVATEHEDIVSYRKFVVSYEGISDVTAYGKPDVDESFSGEVTLNYKYELPQEPNSTDVFRIRLLGFSVSAWVNVEGRVFDTGMTPMYVTLPGELMKKSGSLQITVANTAANEILAKNDLILSHPKAELGYHERIVGFEEHRPPLKLGEVVIERIK